ncbi:YihY/virulence factor BrkB family protein [Starkeya sp. ORNL1]|uniref:YihY/virulence factor BrkB family protein n=1 Tax=Starkeya sp. ORNL1 TaxID=2709380 RepID=UPI001462FA47|nr:YihY/virulence factor BrkB family protein [Starkeya sp. ORNL1]QJP12589.1 YihY/virulence factor BrkB family protein [Starkeya sp. ORNL1]
MAFRRPYRLDLGRLMLAGTAAWIAIVLRMSRSETTDAQSPLRVGRGGSGGTSLEVDRGRLATTPAAIGAGGWSDILRRTYSESIEDRLPTVAAGITFFGLLALFPAVTAIVSLYGLFTDPATVRDHLFALSFMLPAGAFQIVEDQISRIVTQGSEALTVKLLIGLGIALWGANAGMKALIDGLNVAYEETEKRGFVMLNALSLALTLAALTVVMLAMFTVTVAPAAIATLKLSDTMIVLVRALRWVVMAAVLMIGLSVLYRFGPSRENAKWRWVTWGSAVASVLWIMVSVGLSAYLSNFADYNATYGSLGAAIALMMWIWLSSCAVLFGAELNAEMEHQTAIDTTTGPDLPMGLRGATMADTLGQ